MNKSIDTGKSTERAGVLISIVNFTLDVSDKSAATGFALVHDLRTELRTAIDSSIDTTENVVRSVFRVGKRITARVDELVLELTSASERTVAGVVRGVRDTTRAAGELATTAAGAIIGPATSDARHNIQA